MANKPKQFPTIIDTEPAGEDLLDGGSQARIAAAIRESIENRRFKIIGIDGKWGAGKSNVIKIVSRSLGKEYHFFIYDAWAHQEELQRRSFLEELNDELIKEKWISEKKWKEKLKILFSKTKHSVVRDIPKLSYLLIYGLLLTTLNPIAKQFIDIYISDVKVREYLIAIFPFLLALICIVLIVIKEKRKINVSEVISLAKQKETEKYSEERISEYETSVKDFRNWMKDLSDEINGKHLVIVFDNMDRLPAEKVTSLWSNLHTFFSGAAYKNISVLVPFDRSHIGKAFGKDEENKNGTADYFINKTFPIVFSISDVPLAGWKKFFGKKYIEAFGEDAKEAEDVTTIFDRYCKEITPREIITFINTIVSLKLIWKEEIDMRYLALYTATRKDHFNEGRAEILKGTYATPADIIFRGDDKLPGIMSALYYNISPDIASEVTLFRDIEVSAREMDIRKLDLLSKHGDFVVIADHVATTGGVPLDKFTQSLNQLEEQKASESFSRGLKTTWNHLIGRRMSSKEVDEKDFTRTDEILLLKAKDGNRLENLIACICLGLADSRKFSGRTYGLALMAMEDFIAKNKLPVDLPSLIPRKQMSGDQYMPYAGETKDKFDRYNVVVDLTDLESRILEKFPTEMKEIPAAEYLKAFRFQQLKQRIEQHIAGKGFEANQLEGIYDVYKLIAPPPLAILSEDTILRMLAEADEGTVKFYDLSAMKLAYATRALPTSTGEVLLRNSDDQNISEIASRVLFYCNADDLLATTVEFESDPFRLVAKDVILKNRTGSDLFSFNKIFAKYFAIRDAIKVSDKELMDYLSIYSKSLLTEIKLLGVGVVMADEQVIPVIMKSDGPLKQLTIDSLKEYMSHIDNATWGARFNNLNSYDAKLLEISLKTRVIDQMPLAASEGFGSALPTLGNNDIDSLAPHFDSYEFLYAHCDKTILKQVILGIRDHLISNYDGNPNQFLLFEPMLREQGELDERLEDFFGKIIVKSVKDKRILDVMVKHESYYQGFFTLSDKFASEFIAELRRFIEENERDEKVEEYLKFVNDISYITYGPVKIIKGEYISSNDFLNRADVTRRLVEWVENEHRYFFKLTNAIAESDPEHGFSKDLKMEYDYKGETLELNCREGYWVKLP